MPSYRLQEIFHDLREGVPFINTDNLGYTGDVLHTITVRSDGSGDATTLAEAVAQVPAIGIDNGKIVSVRFDLEAGYTYNIDNLQIGLPWCGGIQFLGDGTNPPTIAVAGGGLGIQAVNSELRFDDVNFATQGTGQAAKYVYAQFSSRVDLNGVGMSGDVEKAVHALYNSTIEIDGTTTISGANTANSHGVNVHSSSHLRLDGQIDNFDRGIHADRNATGDVVGATIDSCGVGIHVEDGANVKAVGSSAVTNNSTAFEAINDGTIYVGDTPDLTGNTANYSVSDVSKLRDATGTWQTGAAT